MSYHFLCLILFTISPFMSLIRRTSSRDHRFAERSCGCLPLVNWIMLSAYIPVRFLRNMLHCLPRLLLDIPIGRCSQVRRKSILDCVCLPRLLLDCPIFHVVEDVTKSIGVSGRAPVLELVAVEVASLVSVLYLTACKLHHHPQCLQSDPLFIPLLCLLRQSINLCRARPLVYLGHPIRHCPIINLPMGHWANLLISLRVSYQSVTRHRNLAINPILFIPNSRILIRPLY